ncbi:MAG: phage protease, partial [Syntrophobacteraceae bacterium]
MENDLVRFVAQMPEGEVPAEFQLFPYGLIDVLGGNPFLVDEPGMAAAVSAFKQRGLDMVVDYEHQTLGKTEGADFSSPDGKAPAAGWIKSLDPRGKDGLWAKVEWTAKARELLASREYRYFSPVFYTSKTTGKLVAIENVALTNSPRLNSIRPIVAKHKTEGVVMELLKLIAKALGLPDTATQDEVVAKIGQIQAAGPALLKTVASAVGLSEAATEDQVIASVKSVPAKDAESKEVRTALGLPEAS